ncbi:MAG: hypothetical protein KC619_33750, partial [Myxococcales bacterium]|nr:hypothetical protein [Myxococcales bacterium]
PALTTATLLVWAVALDRGSHRWAAGAGALVWVLSSASYVLGVILVPLVALAGSVTTDAARRRRMATTAGIALVSLVVLMWAATGFDPFAVFATALDDQAGNLASSFRDRAWHETVGWDLWDFAQGLPMIVAIPALALAWRGLRTDDPIARRLASMALAGPLLAALSGALTTETFRTWMFLMPPVFVAAGRELASWPPRHLAVFLACAAVLSATWLQQLRFVWS